MTGITIENAQPLVGGIVHVDKAHLCDDDVIAQIKTALETRGVLVFPRLNASDDEQLAFTDKMGERVNFTRQVPGSDVAAADVYMITLDRKLNNEPDYVLGTFFWHVAGATIDHALPKATTLSACQLSASGGSDSVEAAVCPVHGHPSEERRERYRNLAAVTEQPLVWTHDDGRKSLLFGTHADGIVGSPGPTAARS
ncbi:MAG: TauD/TfdA family dioxygenase [Novosphingobium sp.]